jgi:hypothetical protein
MTAPCEVPELGGQQWKYSPALSMTLYTALASCNNRLQLIEDCYGKGASNDSCAPPAPTK